MKWAFISGGVALLVALLTAAALNQPDVVWNDGEPHCPNCRVRVPAYAEVCPVCRRDFDWKVDARPCRLCLGETEVRYLRTLSEEDVRGRVAAAGGIVAGLDADGVVEWASSIGRHTCVYCAGTGQPRGLEPDSPLAKLAIELGNECPVCVGEDECVACGEDGVTDFGDPAAHRVYAEYVRRRDSGRPLIGAYAASDVAGSFDRTVRDLIGRAEIDLVWFPHDTQSVIEVVEARRDELIELLRPRPPADE